MDNVKVDNPEGQRFEQGVKFKARIAIHNSLGQTLKRTRVFVDQNYRRDLTKVIMELAIEADRLQFLARRDRSESYYVFIEVPASDAIEDEVNSWIAAIANSQINHW